MKGNIVLGQTAAAIRGMAIAMACAGALAVAPGAALASDPASAEPADPLTAVYYRYAVVEYCGLENRDVAAGFDLARDRIVQEQSTNEEAHRRARIAGWTAADLEWSNRGLGGFRRWCESEGVAAASGFLEERAGPSP
jgi:hypothetical protein